MEFKHHAFFANIKKESAEQSAELLNNEVIAATFEDELGRA